MSLKLGLRNKIRRSRAAGGFVGLLDQPFATGATAAYSLRLLRAKHSGGLVRVRADDAGTSKGEADVLPVLQPDGSKIITLNSPIENFSGTPFSGDGYVLADLVDSGNNNYDGLTSKWYGQTPNTNDASQSGASKQPQIVSSGSVIQKNNKPAIQFDGSDDVMTATNITPLTTPTHVFIVGHTNKPNFDQDFLDGDVGSTNKRLLMDNDGGGNRLRIYQGSSAQGGIMGSNQFLFTGLFNGANSIIWKNNNQIVSGDSGGGADGNDSISIGAIAGQDTNFLDGTEQEIIIYNSNKTNELNKIHSEINDYFKIPNF